MDKLLQRLRNDASVFLHEEFGIGLNTPILANGRLKAVYGRFIFSQFHDNNHRIEIAKVTLENGYDVAWAVLRHELVHYAHFVLGLPLHDYEQAFIEACESRGIPVTNQDVHVKQKRVRMVCAECGEEWLQLRKMNGYVHTDCGGDLVFSDYVYV